MSFFTRSDNPTDGSTPEWRIVGKPVSLILAPSVAGKLRQMGSSFSPRAGGLLLGEVVPGKRQRVYVADCVPLIWDRDRGGAPFLDDEQRRIVEREVLAPRAAQNLAVVGYYRADPSPKPALTGADVDLLDRYLPNVTDLCVLIRRERAGVHAAVFLRNNGEFRSGTSISDLQIPLYRLEARVEAEILGRHRPAGSQRQLFLTAGAWMAGAVLIGIMSRGIWSDSLQGRPAEPAPAADVPDPFVYAVAASNSPLGLAVDHSKAELTLLWDSQSQALRSARCGSLAVDEGGRRRTFELPPGTLRKGELTYNKAGADLSFQMNVLTTEGRLFSSAIRVLDGTVPDGYSPLSARFAPAQEFENSIARVALPAAPGGAPVTASSGLRKEGLCADPASPVPGGKPMQVISARTVAGPAFVLPVLSEPLEKKLYVSLEVFLNEQGAIADVQGPVSTAYRDITRFLTQKVRQWRYAPATVDGSPLANSIKFTFAIKQGRWE